MGKRYGLDPEAMVDVLNVSTGMSWVAQTHIKQRVISRRFDDPFKLALMVKDIGIAMRSRAHRAPAPLSDAAQRLWRAAADAASPTPASASWCAGSSGRAAPRSAPAPGRGPRHERSRREEAALGDRHRGPRPGAAPRLPARHRRRRRGHGQALRRHRQPARREHAVLDVARAAGRRRAPRRRRRAARCRCSSRTVSVSDGVSMNHRGMRMSLVSRELIADSIEAVVPRPCLRRAGRLRRLRQDPARRDDGDGAARLPERVRLRRRDAARPLARPGRHRSSPPTRASARCSPAR